MTNTTVFCVIFNEGSEGIGRTHNWVLGVYPSKNLAEEAGNKAVLDSATYEVCRELGCDEYSKSFDEIKSEHADKIALELADFKEETYDGSLIYNIYGSRIYHYVSEHILTAEGI